MRVVKVPLGTRRYSILIGPGLLETVGERLQPLGLGRRCALITDARVAPLYGARVGQSLTQAGFEVATVVIPAGEQAKRLETVGHCYDQLARHRLERKSFVVALGGGVVGDLAGFVAATYLRGIGFVQVPTTLLAQVDSSVGGKVGVNLRAGKNLVGAFYQPRLVLCDQGVFRTLPRREFAAGLAEVIKYGIIYDAPLFRRLEKQMDRLLLLDPAVLAAVVARCCAIKAEVVAQDETESGLRAILNFGHTIGHAFEAVSRYGRYLHGEALALGLVAAARLSAQLLGLPETDVQRIRRLLERAGLTTQGPVTPRLLSRLLDAMRLDKKVSGGEIKFVLARRLGQVVWGQKVPAELIQPSLASQPSTRE